MRLRVKLAAALAASMIAAPLASAGASSVEADYAISLAGFSIGHAGVTSVFDGRRYSIRLQAQMTGLVGMATGGKGAATASGSVAGARVLPSSFAVTSRSARESRTVRMGLRAGSVAAVEIAPPLDERPDRIPVESAHKRGIVDPVSALLMVADARLEATDPDNCNRTIPVFDGASRFDVALSYSRTVQVDKPGYTGPALVCRARWKPISGHRPTRSAVKYMEENEDMAVWLAPVGTGRLLLPLRIEVRTQLGMSVIEASRVTVGSGPQRASLD